MAKKGQEKQEPKLKQTEANFKIAGEVVWLDKEGAYREGTVEKGDLAGNDYRSIRFGVKTSKTNVIPVELFGMEVEEVYVHNKEKGGMKIPFAKRNNPPEGYNIISTGISLERDGKGNLVRKGLVEFDAVKALEQGLKNGDGIFVSGKIVHSKYTNANGVTTSQTKYVMRNVSLLKTEIDFDAENFEEMAGFEHEIVVESVDVDKESNKVFVTGYAISFGEKFETAVFVVDAEKNKKLANSFSKKLKPMDLIKLYGVIANGVEVVENTEEDEDEDDGWGGEKPKGYDRPVKVRVKELRVTGVDAESHKEKAYKADDFLVASADDEESPFAKNKNKGRQAQSLDKDDDEEDDVPF